MVSGGGKLAFETTTGRTLTVSEIAGSAVIRVGASDGSTAGTLECRSPGSGANTIKLNSSTADAVVGIEVETKGFLDIQGNSSADQDCIITNGGVTLDGTRDGYIYLKDGSDTIIKNADISYMGANAANKYGITATDVDGNFDGEGLLVEGSTIRNIFRVRFNSGTTYAVIRSNSIHDGASGVTMLFVPMSNSIIENNTFYNFDGAIDIDG